MKNIDIKRKLCYHFGMKLSEYAKKYGITYRTAFRCSSIK